MDEREQGITADDQNSTQTVDFHRALQKIGVKYKKRMTARARDYRTPGAAPTDPPAAVAGGAAADPPRSVAMS